MSADEWLTLAVLAGLVVALMRSVVGPAVGVMAAAIILLLGGVITADEAFSGFSSSAVMTVAALFVVAGAVERAGTLTRAVERLVVPGRPRLFRLLVPVAALSTIMNNTPIVATAAPAVLSASRRAGVPASRYLMPLSYATILGGVVTTIGTSTNLVVSGLLAERGMAPFSLLDMAPIGAPVAIMGIAVLGLAAGRLLPDREAPDAQVMREPRRYAVELEVVAGRRLDGAQVGRAGLRSLPTLYLAARQSDGALQPLGARATLHGGDIISFVGDVADVASLIADGDLRAVSDDAGESLSDARNQMVEVVMDADSSFVGRTLKTVEFRQRYGAVVVAVHRDGLPLGPKLGAVSLHRGDALLLLCPIGATGRLQHGPDFSVVAPLDPGSPTGRPAGWRAGLPLAITALLVTATATGVLEILPAALGAALLLLATRTITSEDARRSIDLDVLIVIAGSFALGAAMESSGLAVRVADLALSGADIGGRALGVLAVVTLTMVLTEPLSNAASAALMVPVALRVADQLGGDPRLFAVAVAVAASASFLTPIGYQTNMMVYGLGGYRFGDYARLGAPLTLLTLATVTGALLLLAF